MIVERTNERIRTSRHLPTAHFVVEKSLANCERMVWCGIRMGFVQFFDIISIISKAVPNVPSQPFKRPEVHRSVFRHRRSFLQSTQIRMLCVILMFLLSIFFLLSTFISCFFNNLWPQSFFYPFRFLFHYPHQMMMHIQNASVPSSNIFNILHRKTQTKGKTKHEK